MLTTTLRAATDDLPETCMPVCELAAKDPSHQVSSGESAQKQSLAEFYLDCNKRDGVHIPNRTLDLPQYEVPEFSLIAKSKSAYQLSRDQQALICAPLDQQVEAINQHLAGQTRYLCLDWRRQHKIGTGVQCLNLKYADLQDFPRCLALATQPRDMTTPLEGSAQ